MTVTASTIALHCQWQWQPQADSGSFKLTAVLAKYNLLVVVCDSEHLTRSGTVTASASGTAGQLEY